MLIFVILRRQTPLKPSIYWRKFAVKVRTLHRVAQEQELLGPGVKVAVRHQAGAGDRLRFRHARSPVPKREDHRSSPAAGEWPA